MIKIKQKQLETKYKNAKLDGVKIQKDKTVVKKTKEIKMKWTPESAKDFVDGIAKTDANPEQIMTKLAEQLSSYGTPNWKFREALDNALMIYGLDNHKPISDTVDKRYKPLVREFSRQLIQEYDCKISSEKALAQIVAGAYARIIEYSKELNNCMWQKWPENNRFNCFLLFSKELDRAERHFITALMALKQLKSPSVEFNIKAKTAFVAQNQQINDINNLNVKKDETIEPK